MFTIVIYCALNKTIIELKKKKNVLFHLMQEHLIIILICLFIKHT